MQSLSDTSQQDLIKKQRRKRQPKKFKVGKHYVDNKTFYDALVEYKKLWKKEEDDWNILYGEEKQRLLDSGIKKKDLKTLLPPINYPRIPEYIGECIFFIASRTANRANFIRYSWKDDMVADGYENCVLRIRSFDPDISENPFGYFTQICWFAFLRRIEVEKAQKDIKVELIKNSGILNDMQFTTNDGDDGQYDSTYIKFLHDMVDTNGSQNSEDASKHKVIKKTTKLHQKRLKAKKELDDYVNKDGFWTEDLSILKEYYGDDD